MVHHDPGSLAGKQRDGRGVHGQAALDGERLPRRALLILGETERVFARLAQGGAVHLARAAAAHVAHHELQRPPDGRIGPVPLAQRVDAGVHADRAGDRAVDDHDRARRVGRGQEPVDVERVGAGGLDRGEHDGQVLRPAAGQHRVDGDLLDRARHEIRWHHRDALGGIARGTLEHTQHALARWRDDGQPIGPAPRIAGLDLVLELT